jgi:N-acetylneuraminic acid mutarotase
MKFLLAIFVGGLWLVPAARADDESAEGTSRTRHAGAWQKRSSFLKGRIYHSAVWTYGEMIVWGGGSNHQFHNDGGIYDPGTDQWRAVSQKDAPSGRWGHAAVWTGTEMIVWGGRDEFARAGSTCAGGRYDPKTDTWKPMSVEGAPSARSQMAAVWTGQQMIVWGGVEDGGKCPTTGGMYDPNTDKWTALEAEGAPEGRMEVVGVWSGREFIVWGGLLEGFRKACGTGGRYDPETKKWKALPMEGAPKGARGLQAVWTGREMLVWGGAHIDEGEQLNIGSQAGARYHPETDEWQPTTLKGAPAGRMCFGAAWTGSELIVLSGGDQQAGNLSSGGRYDPIDNEWVSTAKVGAPSGRGIVTTIWTGEGVLLYGGSTGGADAYNETYYYLPEATPEKEPEPEPTPDGPRER